MFVLFSHMAGTAGAEQRQQSGQVDSGCPASIPYRLSPPAEFAAFIVACETYDQRLVSIKNVSAGVVRLQPWVATAWSGWTAPLGDFSYRAAAAVVRGGPVATGELYSGFDLRPGEKVNATVSTGRVELSVDVRYWASAYSYVARFVADWVKSMFVGTLPQGIQLGISFSECVTQLTEVLSEDPALWEDLVRDAIKTTATCGSFAQGVLRYVDDLNDVSRGRALSIFAAEMDDIADGAARARWSAQTAFDDVIRAATRVARVFT